MEAPGFLLALAAGLLSFLSPCVLPMIPSYLGFLGGAAARDLEGGKARLLGRSLLFVAGFALVFVAMGLFLRGLLSAVGAGRGAVSIVAGVLVALFGLNTLLDFVRFLRRERRASTVRARGLPGAFLLGVAFAAGWSPCLGPILGSILALASTQGRAVEAGFLLLAYSAGLAIPFIAAAAAFSRLKPLLDWLKARSEAVRRFSGILLVLVGLAMIFLTLDGVNSAIFSWGYALALFADESPLAAHALAIGFYLLAAAALVVPPLLRKRALPLKRRIGPARAILLGLLALLAILEAAGVLTLFRALDSWTSASFL